MKATKSETEIAINLYESDFGVVDKSCGYSLTVSKSQSGNVVVKKWYQRNSWVDDKLEHTVVYSPDLKIKHQAPVRQPLTHT
jgi:uncharacterized protein YodC (DUF2158 family)